ncbi:MAG: hypothetical protein ACFFAJ_07975 [Candidatus Hodarchaeota archaeon]
MNESIVILEKQFSYLKKVLSTRKEHFQESFECSLFNGESTASEVYVHGLRPLYKNSYKILKPDFNDSSIKFEMNMNLNLIERYIELYERTLQLLKQVQLKLTDEDLNKPLKVSVESKSQISLREWICLNVMHTVTHIGQALRLQALYIRNKLK